MTLDYEQKLKDLDTFYHEKIELLNRNIEKQIIRELNKKVKSGVTASGIEKRHKTKSWVGCHGMASLMEFSNNTI